MKANEFIKKFGWCSTENYSDHGVNINDLKCYMSAYAMIQDLCGLSKAKKYVESPYTAPEIVESLNKAIALIEECQ